jgi:hypothetical protein
MSLSTLNLEQGEFHNFVYYHQDNIFVKHHLPFNNIVLLNAPAGTGKSYTIKLLIKSLKRYKVLAPTNKACSILSKDIPNATTIHKFFNSVCEIDDNGNKKFVISNKLNYTNYVIIVDECSMINEEMYNIFKELSTKNLIVFVGDELQLPPIEDGNEKSMKSKCFTSTNAIFEFITNMRSRLLASTLMLENARKACYNMHMPASLNEVNIQYIIDTFKENMGTNKSAVVLTYTNASVNNYCNVIRSNIFNKDVENLDKYYVNEKLIYSGNCTKNGMKYVTSDEIIIKQLKIVELKLDFKRCSCKNSEFKRTKCKLHDFRKDFMILSFYEIIDQNKNTWYKPLNIKHLY